MINLLRKAGLYLYKSAPQRYYTVDIQQIRRVIYDTVILSKCYDEWVWIAKDEFEALNISESIKSNILDMLKPVYKSKFDILREKLRLSINEYNMLHELGIFKDDKLVLKRVYNSWIWHDKNVFDEIDSEFKDEFLSIIKPMNEYEPMNKHLVDIETHKTHSLNIRFKSSDLIPYLEYTGDTEKAIIVALKVKKIEVNNRYHQMQQRINPCDNDTFIVSNPSQYVIAYELELDNNGNPIWEIINYSELYKYKSTIESFIDFIKIRQISILNINGIFTNI